MDYLERYIKGEHVQVWEELTALGPAVRKSPHSEQARAVAVETMLRVRRNCELLISRLKSLGYVFGVYPDGSRGYASEGSLVLPSSSTLADIAELDELVGPLPLSLAAFWDQVGSVDFVGMRRGWAAALDPLVVYPPIAALSMLDAGDKEFEPESFQAPLAPDNLHKDNVSGGEPYSVALPNASADFELLNERHGMMFVPYLRLAILKWGGFPGLENKQIKFDSLESLVQGLEPF